MRVVAAVRNIDRFDVEYTDTYGGEANYCWVDRKVIEVPAHFKRGGIIRRAKAAVGLTGVSGRTFSSGDGYEFRPWGSCTVMFVSWKEPGEGLDS